MNEREASYQLNLSRIFGVTPPAIYRAFTDAGLLAEWFPRPGWSMPPELVEIDPRPGGRLRYVLVSIHDPARRRATSAEFWDAEEHRLLAWTKEPSWRASAGRPGPARAVRVEFVAEPHRTTRLELREWPFSEAAECDARECWNLAFGRLDRALAEVAVAR
jgi:uncharacterized protein YndB with AHSA1/START domain